MPDITSAPQLAISREVSQAGGVFLFTHRNGAGCDRSGFLTAWIIEKSADLLAGKSAESRFCMVVYPGSKLMERLGKAFEGSRVEVLDYSRRINW